MPIQYDHVPVNGLTLEKSLYQTLAKMKYHSGDSEVSISSLINDMLKEYLHTYVLSKSMGYVIVPSELVNISSEYLTGEQIKEQSTASAIRYKEGVILEEIRPSLNAYLKLIRAFAKANNFVMEVSRNPENENQVLIISFHMGYGFSQFLGNTYRILLQEYADIVRMEVTPTSVYFEYKPKKEVVQETSEIK